jgi:hypothetical protein
MIHLATDTVSKQNFSHMTYPREGKGWSTKWSLGVTRYIVHSIQLIYEKERKPYPAAVKSEMEA